MIADSVLLYYGLPSRDDAMDKNDFIAMIEARIKEIDTIATLPDDKYGPLYKETMARGKYELSRLLLQLRYRKKNENEHS